MKDWNIPERERVARRAQQLVDAVYAENFPGRTPPRISPGVVDAVLKACAEMPRELLAHGAKPKARRATAGRAASGR